jgi:tetratricopeptide (TPR) repeat protein
MRFLIRSHRISALCVVGLGAIGISLCGCRPHTGTQTATEAPTTQRGDMNATGTAAPRAATAGAHLSGQKAVEAAAVHSYNQAQAQAEMLTAAAIHPKKPLTHATPINQIPLGKQGVGLVVCEPVATNSEAATASLGAGCTRWLQFTVGGQGALGRTPLWTSVDRARHELGRPDLRMNAEDAFRLAAATGATHVAVGEITGSGTATTLRYQLYSTANRQPVGAPLQAIGPHDKIVTALPGLASQLAAQLGVKTPHLPTRVEGSAADLILIGSLPWLPDAETVPATRQTLVKLAERMPLAGILALHSNPTRPMVGLSPLVDRLLKQVPTNSLAFAEAGWGTPDLLPRHADTLATDRKRFPGNYLFALTDVWLQRINGETDAERRAAEQVVQNAPDNSDAWLTLGATIANEAETIRQSRYASAMTRKEWALLNVLYPQWLSAEMHAAKLDPASSRAWERVAEAATFAGQQKQATDALWESLRLDPDNLEAYAWGLQMFQPKWTRDTHNLVKLAGMAAEHFHYDENTFGLVENLRQSQLPADADQMLTAIETHNREYVRADPTNLTARRTLAWALKERRNYAQAAAVLREAGPQAANDAKTHYTLGMIYAEWGRYPKSVPEFQQAVQLAPDEVAYRIKLGGALKVLKRFSEAETELQNALRIDPRSSDTWRVLGDTYQLDKKPDQSIHAYREAVRLRSWDYIAWGNMGYMLAAQQKYTEAVAAGEKARLYNPNSLETHLFLSYAYAKNDQPAASESEARIVLAQQPNNITAHENLGDALGKLGKRAEAREEWQYVLQNGKGNEEFQEAQRNLAKYP